MAVATALRRKPIPIDKTLQSNRQEKEKSVMSLVMENDASRVAVERLSNADRLWTDVAQSYGNRVSLALPDDRLAAGC